jgi:hypothetical protein
VKKGTPIAQRKNTPLGCTPFLLPKPIEEVPKDQRGIDALIAGLYSPDEGPEQPLPEALGVFFAAVKGNQAVIKDLLEGATRLIAILQAVAENNPEVLRPIARKVLWWPDFIGVKGEFDKNRRLLEHLEVGKECSMRGKWQPESRATASALLMHTWLHTNQGSLALPRLTRATRKQWFEAGWNALRDSTGGHPERNSFFRQIGLHYGEHSKKVGAQQKVTPATLESNIRAGIKKQLWQSFKSLTHHRPVR